MHRPSPHGTAREEAEALGSKSGCAPLGQLLQPTQPVKANEEPVSTDSARACGGVPTPTSARYRRGKGMYPDGKGAAKSGTNKTAADEGTTHPSTKRFTTSVAAARMEGMSRPFRVFGNGRPVSTVREKRSAVPV